MEIFEYKVDLFITVWQRVDVEVIDNTKEEADARIIKLVKAVSYTHLTLPTNSRV